MRIFHFIYDHTRNPWVAGGGAQRVKEIYTRLAHKHDISIFSGEFPGAHNYSSGSVEFRFLGTQRNNYIMSTFSYALEAAKFLKRNHMHADIIVEDFAPYNPIFSYKIRNDAILQLHQKEGVNILRKYNIFGLPFYLIEKNYASHFRKITAVSKQYGLDVPIISNGIDESYLTTECENKSYMLYIGRLEMDSKGLDILFNAMNKISRIHLKIAGKGKDEAKVRKLALSNKKNKIELVGFIEGEKKKDIIKNCTAVIIPSRFEAQSIVALEAAALGKPIIASNIPGLSYVVSEGLGLSFASALGLARLIIYFNSHLDVSEMWSRRARHFAKDFTWDKIAQQYEDFLLKGDL